MVLKCLCDYEIKGKGVGIMLIRNGRMVKDINEEISNGYLVIEALDEPIAKLNKLRADYAEQIEAAKKNGQPTKATALQDELDRRLVELKKSIRSEKTGYKKLFDDMGDSFSRIQGDTQKIDRVWVKKRKMLTAVANFDKYLGDFKVVQRAWRDEGLAFGWDFTGINKSIELAKNDVSAKGHYLTNPNSTRLKDRGHYVATRGLAILLAAGLAGGAMFLANRSRNERQTSAYVTIINEQDNQIKSLNELIKEKDAMIKDLNDKIAELQGIIDSNPGSAENAELREQIKSLQTIIVSLENDVKALNNEIVRLQGVIAEKDKELSAKDKRIQELQNAISTPGIPEDTLKMLQAQLDQAIAERDAARAERDAAIAERDAAKKDFEELNKKYKAVVAENTELKQENADLKTQVSKLEGEKKTLEGKVSTLQSKVDSLQSQLDAEKGKNTKLQSELDQAKADLAKAQSDLAKKTTEYNNLKKKYDAEVKKNQTTNAAIDNLYRKYYIDDGTLSAEQKLEEIGSYIDKTKAELEAQNNFDARQELIDILCEVYGSQVRSQLEGMTNKEIVEMINKMLGINEPSNGGSGKVRDGNGGNSYEQPTPAPANYEDEEDPTIKTGNGKVREP